LFFKFPVKLFFIPDLFLCRVYKGRLAEMILGQEYELGLLEDIRHTTAEYGVSQEELADAISEAIFEAAQKARAGEISADDHRPYVLGLIFWKLFGKGTEVWITLTCRLSAVGARRAVPPSPAIRANWDRVAARRRAVQIGRDFDANGRMYFAGFRTMARMWFQGARLAVPLLLFLRLACNFGLGATLELR
jgi:hypothetical protein